MYLTVMLLERLPPANAPKLKALLTRSGLESPFMSPGVISDEIPKGEVA